MFRPLRRFATIAAVIGIGCAPGTAIAADAPAHDTHRGTVVIGDNNQVAGRDINNAGRDNTAGSDAPGDPDIVDSTLIIINTTRIPAVLVSQTGSAIFPRRIDGIGGGAASYTSPAGAVYQLGSEQVIISIDDDGNPSCTPSGELFECNVDMTESGIFRITLV